MLGRDSESRPEKHGRSSTIDVTAVTPVERPWGVPGWLRTTGVASWLVVGVIVVVGLVIVGVVALAGVFVPLLFAAFAAAVFYSLVDRLEAWHLPRTVAALLVLALIIAIAALVTYIVVVGIVQEAPTIYAQLENGVDSLKGTLQDHGVGTEQLDQLKSSAQQNEGATLGGLASLLGGTLQKTAQLLFGIFIALNMLFWILKDGRPIGRWLARHGALPAQVATPILASSVNSLRRYFVGLTIVSALNGIVVTFGALVIGVPLALTIGIVTFVTAYVPYFGAIIGGAFAVLIALGAGGSSEAIAMLVVVILANGPIQTVVSPLIMGSSLNIHPLAILLLTTGGGIVAGLIGGMFAAPLAKVVMDTAGVIRTSRLFDYTGRGPGPPSEDAIEEGLAALGKGEAGEGAADAAPSPA